jgi:hypothetical protein
MDTGGTFLGAKRSRRETEKSFITSAEIRNARIYMPAPKYVKESFTCFYEILYGLFKLQYIK